MKFPYQCALAVVLLGLFSPGGPGRAAASVVVEKVGQGSVLERAGLRPGDLVLSWEQPPGQGPGQEEIRTVSDWFRLKDEQAPRGSLRLRGERDGAAFSFEVPKGDWESRVRPQMAADLLATYMEGRRRIEAGDVEAGADLWDRLARVAPDLEPWLLLQTGEAWSGAGQAGKARAALEAALATPEATADAEVRMAVLEALGQSYQTSSDLDKAEAFYRSALETGRTARGESLQVARLTSRLGTVRRRQNRIDEAAQLLAEALELRQRLAPDSLDVADSLEQLSALAWSKGDQHAFYDLARRALAIQERWAPGTLDAADILNYVAISAIERGLFEEGKATLQRALAIQERLAPGTTHLSMTLGNLGSLMRQMGDLEAAEELHERALAIQEKLAPESLLARAVDALESQVGRLGGSYETRAQYRASYAEIYREAIEIELAQGHAAEAFHLVERSRARSFLALLADRDIAFRDLPADLEASRRDNAERYDRALLNLSRWSPQDGNAGEEEREALLRDLASLRRERDEIADRIRSASPRVAALREPQPLDAESARKVLDPGTLALSYSVGKEQTALFAVTRDGGLRVTMLAVGEERLRREVESFLEQVRQPASGSAAEVSRSLYRELVEPVADLVERSERLLILPDGPLHRLPFAALRASSQFLIEQKPLHTALSLTIYGTVRAWEIFESVRLDADLVVLSSCESALGRELSGEGLVGLTRAFQYAGARSVVASLWSVADRVTAELMARFYRHYAAGLPKDEALRAAQIEMIRGPIRLVTSKGQAMKMDASAPFFWAAFELFGDRR